MKKKILIIIGVIICILFITGFLTSRKDSAYVRNGLEPRFVIKTISYHGDKVTYWGLGYKVIRYVNVSPKEPFENNRGVKYGSWFMKYEIEKNLNPEEINEYIINYLENHNDLSDVAFNYVDETTKKVIVGLTDNSVAVQEKFISKVFSSCCGSQMIKEIKNQNIINFVESRYKFEGKIVKAEENYIIVEVLKDSEIFKVKSNVTIKITRPTNGTNDFYVVGNKVRVIFNGNVEETDPAQIEAINIELIS